MNGTRFILGAVMAMGLAAHASAQEEVSIGTGAVLRGLDKISGELTDMELADGTARQLGRIEVSVQDCRYPSGNPSGNAYAHIIVRNIGSPDPTPVFSGWMIASSPALNALDHPRYDVWVLRCMTS